MSDWLPGGFITLHQRQKQTSWPLTHRSLSFSFFLSLSPPLSVCLPVRLSRALSPVLADFGFVWQAKLWGSTLIEERTKLTLPSLKQLSCPRQSHRWNTHGKQIHANTLTNSVSETRTHRATFKKTVTPENVYATSFLLTRFSKQKFLSLNISNTIHVYTHKLALWAVKLYINVSPF